MKDIIKKMADAHLKAIRDTHKSAKILAYKGLLEEIEEHNYTTIAQVKGAIHLNIDTIEKLDESDEYEADARADHFSEEQFNNE